LTKWQEADALVNLNLVNQSQQITVQTLTRTFKPLNLIHRVVCYQLVGEFDVTGLNLLRVLLALNTLAADSADGSSSGNISLSEGFSSDEGVCSDGISECISGVAFAVPGRIILG
jgi:hypothetical protein